MFVAAVVKVVAVAVAVAVGKFLCEVIVAPFYSPVPRGDPPGSWEEGGGTPKGGCV
jgi:hypothetical protein